MWNHLFFCYYYWPVKLEFFARPVCDRWEILRSTWLTTHSRSAFSTTAISSGCVNRESKRPVKVKQKERLKEMMLGPQRLFQLAGLSLFSLVFAWLLWLVVFSNIGDRYGDAIYSLYSSCWEYYILELSCGRLHPTLCVSPSKSFHLSNFIDSYAHVCVAMVLWLRPSSFMFVFFSVASPSHPTSISNTMVL